MSLKQLIIAISAFTLMLWFGWAWTLFAIDPYSTNWVGFALFYTTLFLSLSGSLAVITTMVRQKFSNQPWPLFALVMISFRQSVWLSGLIVLMLALLSQQYLKWWLVLLVVVLCIFIEWLFLRKHEPAIHRNRTSRVEQRLAQDIGPAPRFIKKKIQN